MFWQIKADKFTLIDFTDAVEMPVLTPAGEMQPVKNFRADAASFIDRENVATQLDFNGVVRVFETFEEAAEYYFTIMDKFPGNADVTITFQANATKVRKLPGAYIKPGATRWEGCSVFTSFRIDGGRLTK